MAARRRLSVLPSCPTVLQSCLGILQFCLSILQSRPVSSQSSPRRSSVLALNFDQLRAPFTESTPPAAAKSHAPFTGSASLLPPKPQSPIAGLLRCCRRSLTYLLRDFPVEAVCSLQKQKSRHFCNFFVFEPRGWLQDGPGAFRGGQRCGRGSARPWGTPSGRSRGLTMQDGLERSREAARHNIAKTKKRGHPASDALALFSNDVAPTLALTPYSRTQVPSSDRIPRLYA